MLDRLAERPATAVFLEITGITPTLAENDAVCELVISAAASDLAVGAMAVQLRALVHDGRCRTRPRVQVMRLEP